MTKIGDHDSAGSNLAIERATANGAALASAHGWPMLDIPGNIVMTPIALGNRNVDLLASLPAKGQVPGHGIHTHGSTPAKTGGTRNHPGPAIPGTLGALKQDNRVVSLVGRCIPPLFQLYRHERDVEQNAISKYW